VMRLVARQVAVQRGLYKRVNTVPPPLRRGGALVWSQAHNSWGTLKHSQDCVKAFAAPQMRLGTEARSLSPHNFSVYKILRTSTQAIVLD
jgi:hypothetical protein